MIMEEAALAVEYTEIVMGNNREEGHQSQGDQNCFFTAVPPSGNGRRFLGKTGPAFDRSAPVPLPPPVVHQQNGQRGEPD